jgi:predicted phosphoribosyltransferase
MTSADLAGLQRTIRSIDRIVAALVVLTVVLLGVTIATSQRRRRTVLQLAGGLLLSVAVATLLAQQLEAVVLEAITHPSGDRVAGVLLGELAHDLRSVAVLVGLAALATGVAAYVLGQPRWLARTREETRRQVPTGDRSNDPTTYQELPRPPAATGAPNERDG